MIVEAFVGCLPAEGFPGVPLSTATKAPRSAEGVLSQIGAFREVLAQWAVGVLVDSALPRTPRRAAATRDTDL